MRSRKRPLLYNFAKYVEWPAKTDAAVGDSSVFVIGVVGENPFGRTLDNLAQKKQINGRRILIRSIRTETDYRPCHLVFVAADAPAPLVAHVLQAAKQSSTLTVGERPGFTQAGGMINLYLEGNRVKFEINLRAARDERIEISSKLLSIGKVVHY